MSTSNKNILQTATTIAKTTPTLIGHEINVSMYNYLTLYLDYVKGDETGLNVYLYERCETGGTDYQDVDWTNSSGTVTATANNIEITASASRPIVVDCTKFNYIVFKQGGSNNDGTPTGTLAASYTLTR